MVAPLLPPNAREGITVLLISSVPEDLVSLRHILDHSNWQVRSANTCRDALRCARESDTAVVICRRVLPDGDWRLVLEELGRFAVYPNLIVTAGPLDEELWAEVLNLGGYDVLVQPFDSDEVYRVVALAWHDWKRRARTAERQASEPTRSPRQCSETPLRGC